MMASVIKSNELTNKKYIHDAPTLQQIISRQFEEEEEIEIFSIKGKIENKI